MIIIRLSDPMLASDITCFLTCYCGDQTLLQFFKPGVWPSAASDWFLEIALVCVSVCVCMCVCVRVSTPKGINNQWRDM